MTGNRYSGKLSIMAVTRAYLAVDALAVAEVRQFVEPSAEYSFTEPVKAVVEKAHLFVLASTAASAAIRPAAVPFSLMTAETAAASA